MNDVIKITSKFKAAIEYDGQNVRFIGGLALFRAMNDFKTQWGADPKKWPTFNPKNSDEVLILHFIKTLTGEKVINYSHEELCHCRMISTNDVVSSIRQGCQTISEVGRVTKAGTGCGACHKTIQTLFEDLKF